MEKIVIAIDGYSSCGKSTIAQGLSKKLGYIYIDSGAMYRAVTLYCIRHTDISPNHIPEDKIRAFLADIHLEFKVNPLNGQSDIFLNGVDVENEIRNMEVSNYVSVISAIKEVRDVMVELQRGFGKSKGIVMDGRDIGTNVFPEAELKLFVTADEEVRAQRRWKELEAKGMNLSMEEIKANISQRDHEDTHRAYNPLRKAKDAIVLDNTSLTIEEQLNFVLELVKRRT